ncbi:alkyl/aryl-sulfatase [Noviherbaspirillum galbum]|uniref:Linear primary-alkylsulfatase n=2 Tax=Noviherbaspirillum galbum TaxID=2709383 RepID=A0A6B3SLG9_9BURK|nr:alkyl sulfatase dimerization domain-containing protein [Noviherbaspirillum galbum]NEX61684.1 MBL fold metallo-hydrolase [Noviherbaspirillum galbum]
MPKSATRRPVARRLSAIAPIALFAMMFAAFPAGAAEPQAGPRAAEPATVQSNKAWLERLPFGDRQDFEDASRGFIAALGTEAIRAADGHVVWDRDAYAFEAAPDAPPTVNPSLWRQARLNNAAGLFKVADRLYQIRGIDLSNMTIVEGDTGLLIIDPLLSAETAQAGLALYFQHRPRKPVAAVIYTHSHVDHFGGVKGVISEADAASGKVKVIAPAGFMEEAVSENVLAGNAMSRRAQYMYGALLPKNPAGQVDAGLGKGLSRGTITLIAPNELISKPVEARRIDGVDIEFQLTPGTEAPAEMNLYFPGMRALCIAENAVHTQHNLLTLRGAKVRDAKLWSYYLGETLRRYGGRSEVMLGQHHWPTWGGERVSRLLAEQRDMYAYLNDQTLRLLNHGYTPMEIAERLQRLPEPLASQWHARDYYGSISHNVRAVYQRYLGYYDGNPANLNPLPPADAARKTIAWMGGPDAVLEKARAAYAQGDYRWVAQIGNQLVFADPQNRAARELQANALEQLGYQSENSTWRNAYLSGAQELRNGVSPLARKGTASADLVQALTVPMFMDFLAVRLNADKAAGKAMTFNWNFTDLGERYGMNLSNGALTYLADFAYDKPTAAVTLTKAVLDQISTGRTTLKDAVQQGLVTVAGNPEAFAGLFGMLDSFAPAFEIVTPVTGR